MVSSYNMLDAESVEKTLDFQILLWCTSDMLYVDEAVGSTIAWPADKVLMDSKPR
ncbi:hypothetical protein RHGRI_011731 [Rhododendron griersonianum]|uniref:Uncharacterized protein n=1 Tax=Rhododendron griersonianum TaxID=479676 RepID=A0AAV6KPA4_9ERIC|nr:hypothetical protein RHGRI_011731 [Rhododendron griersonianum]